MDFSDLHRQSSTDCTHHGYAHFQAPSLLRLTISCWPEPSQLEEELVVNSITAGRPVVSLRRSYNQGLRKHPLMVLLKMPDAIFFDLDGVLANEEYFNELVAQHFLKNHGIEALIEDLHHATINGTPDDIKNRDLWPYVINRVIDAEDLDVSTVDRFGAVNERLREELRSIEEGDRRYERDFPLVSGRTLKHLCHYVHLFLATNRHIDAANYFVREIRLGKVFRCDASDCRLKRSTIYGRDPSDGTRTKPDPDMLIKAAVAHGLIGKTIWMVGDSDSDLGILSENARQHGLFVVPIGVLRPGLGYHVVAENRLFDAGAVVVAPSAHHLIKDFFRAFDLAHGNLDLPNYYKTRRLMIRHKATIRYMRGQRDSMSADRDLSRI